MTYEEADAYFAAEAAKMLREPTVASQTPREELLEEVGRLISDSSPAASNYRRSLRALEALMAPGWDRFPAGQARCEMALSILRGEPQK